MIGGTVAMNKERLYGPDAVKCAAVLLVVSVHFFLNTGYYSLPLSGAVMAVCTWLRMLFMVCVPLFMMLTGWLATGRSVRDGWLRGLWRTLAVWLVSSAICLLFRRFVQGETFDLRTIFLMIMNFSAVPYGWYVEMYIGLYLLTPLLAAAWRAMDERARRAAVVSLLVLSVLPTVSNIPTRILPEWWTGIYPVAYFCLGAWLKDHPMPKLGNAALAAVWALIAAAAAGLRWYFARGDVFTWAPYTDWNSAFVAAQSVCAFLLFSRCTGTRTPRPVRFCVSAAAKLSLPLYLSSYMADSLLYPLLLRAADTMAARLACLPLMVLCVVVCAAAAAWVTDKGAALLVRLVPQKKPKQES